MPGFARTSSRIRSLALALTFTLASCQRTTLLLPTATGPAAGLATAPVASSPMAVSLPSEPGAPSTPAIRASAILSPSTSTPEIEIPESPSQPPATTMPFTGTLLIADAGNNRLLQVTADKRIVWTFPVTDSIPLTTTFRYPDDAFFSPDGRMISVNEESNHVVAVIDYAARRLVWQFGQPGRPGSDLQHLYRPDDAHLLPDGRIAVADIRNCRILLIPWDQREVQSLGSPINCSGRAGSFGEPNGVTPLPNGDLLITEITTHRASEIDLQGHVIRSVILPISYPSDAYPTPRDTIIVSDYRTPGRVIETDWTGHVLWSFPALGSREWLDRPSIAFELPTGAIVLCDDHHHRVMVVNRQGDILWQYGVTNHPGRAAGYLDIPDGLDWRPDGNG